MHQETVRDVRRGECRADDQLCPTGDTEWDFDRSVGPPVLGSGFPVAGPGAGSSAWNAALTAKAAAGAARSSEASWSAAASLRVMIEMALRRGPWDAACISVRGPDGTMHPAACSDEFAADADGLQVRLGEGPCLDAVRPDPAHTRPESMVVADLTAEHRWPRWGPAATALGIQVVVAQRLFTDRTVGSISLYGRHSSGWGHSVLEDAQTVAAVASVVLAQVCTERNLRRAIDSRGLIGQAQGMLMQRHGLTAESAFAVLRRYSQQHNTKLVVLAEQLTTTGDLQVSPGPHPVRERKPANQSGTPHPSVPDCLLPAAE